MPPEIKNEINFAKKNAKLVKYLTEIAAFLVVLIGFFGVLTFVIGSEQKVATIEKNLASAQVNNQQDIVSGSQDLATRINLIGQLSNQKINWTEVLSALSASTPANVQLETANISSDPKVRTKIFGYASSNTDVVLFKDLLAGSKQFQYVDIESITPGSDPTGANRPTQVFSLTGNMVASTPTSPTTGGN
jgi:Tfp pilus assembly protein PilN